VINYSGCFNATATTALVRIDYTGSCASVGLADNRIVPDRDMLLARGLSLDVSGVGEHSLRLADLQGRVVA
jgi:hypothetical protein